MSGGRIYLEIQFDQGVALVEIFAGHEPFEDVRVLNRKFISWDQNRE